MGVWRLRDAVVACKYVIFADAEVEIEDKLSLGAISRFPKMPEQISTRVRVIVRNRAPPLSMLRCDMFTRFQQIAFDHGSVWRVVHGRALEVGEEHISAPLFSMSRA